jgi:hypothetical protein
VVLACDPQRAQADGGRRQADPAASAEPAQYLRHRLTNAGLEGLNAVIHGIKKTARGFRNTEHFKTAIYFHCGGLDLYPHETP